jgi:V-type H+-transporting ATPase subunit G
MIKKILTRTLLLLLLLLLLHVEKTARIKQAKDEAEAEIQSYRNQREQQYQQMLAQATGGSDELARELETKAKQAEANMRATIEKKGASVTGMLVKHVTSVQL